VVEVAASAAASGAAASLDAVRWVRAVPWDLGAAASRDAVPWVPSAFVALPGVVEYVRVGDAPVGAAAGVEAGVEAGAAVGDGPLRLALRLAWRSVPLRLVLGAGVEAGATTVCNGTALPG